MASRVSPSDFAQSGPTGDSETLDNGRRNRRWTHMLLRLLTFIAVFEEVEQERAVLDANPLTTGLRPAPLASLAGQWELLRTGCEVHGIHVDIKPCAQPLARAHF